MILSCLFDKKNDITMLKKNMGKTAKVSFSEQTTVDQIASVIKLNLRIDSEELETQYTRDRNMFTINKLL